MKFSHIENEIESTAQWIWKIPYKHASCCWNPVDTTQVVFCFVYTCHSVHKVSVIHQYNALHWVYLYNNFKSRGLQVLPHVAAL